MREAFESEKHNLKNGYEKEKNQLIEQHEAEKKELEAKLAQITANAEEEASAKAKAL